MSESIFEALTSLVEEQAATIAIMKERIEGLEQEIYSIDREIKRLGRRLNG